MAWLLGCFRPLTGAVFAALLYVLIEGGLVTFTTAPHDATKRVLFFAGLAFAAGFSERIAQIVPDIPAAGSGQVPPSTIAQIAQQATESDGHRPPSANGAGAAGNGSRVGQKERVPTVHA